jgi:hypothetical protein
MQLNSSSSQGSSLSPRSVWHGPKLVATRISAICASLLVLTVAVVYLVAPTTEALAVTLQSHHASVGKKHEVIYGKVLNSSSKPIRGATITVGDPLATKTSTKGVFREVLSLAPGKYSVGCSLRVGGKILHATTNAYLSYGSAYDLRCKVTVRNVLYVFPVGNY